MTNQQVIQLIIFILFVGGSGIGWVFRKIGEQAQRRAAQVALERQRAEAFRTGRPVEERESSVAAATMPTPRPRTTPDADPAPATLADRRRQQLEELRRRQLARAQATSSPSSTAPAPRGQGGAGAQPNRSSPMPVGLPTDLAPGRTAPTMPRSIPGSSGPTVPSMGMPGRNPPRSPVPRPRNDKGFSPAQAAAEAARREAQRRQQDRLKKKSDEQLRRQAEEARRVAQRADEATESSTQRLVKDVSGADAAYAIDRRIPQAASANRSGAAMPGRTGRTVMLMGQETSIEDWRRSMVMNEILAPCVAMREFADTPMTQG